MRRIRSAYAADIRQTRPDQATHTHRRRALTQIPDHIFELLQLLLRIGVSLVLICESVTLGSRRCRRHASGASLKMEYRKRGIKTKRDLL